MADSDGLVKLAEAIRYLDLVGMVGWQNDDGQIDMAITVRDGEGMEYMTRARIHEVSSVAWIQLPLTLVDAIVCQSGERAKRTEIDRRSRSDHANRAVAAEETKPDPGKRRAFVSCDQHRQYVAFLGFAADARPVHCDSCQLDYLSKSSFRRWQKKHPVDPAISRELADTLTRGT